MGDLVGGLFAQSHVHFGDFFEDFFEHRVFREVFLLAFEGVFERLEPLAESAVVVGAEQGNDEFEVLAEDGDFFVLEVVVGVEDRDDDALEFFGAGLEESAERAGLLLVFLLDHLVDRLRDDFDAFQAHQVCLRSAFGPELDQLDELCVEQLQVRDPLVHDLRDEKFHVGRVFLAQTEAQQLGELWVPSGSFLAVSARWCRA